MIRTRAAILRAFPGKYEIAEVDLDEPRYGEVLVRMVASGLCHTDDHLATGDVPVPVLPVCGGHEGAGIVAGVGPGVHHLAEGDHVVFSFMPACGRCRFCARGHQSLCDLGANVLVGSRPDDPTSFRMHLDGRPVGQMAGLGTFAEHTTVDVRSCVKVPADIPLAAACLTGCGVGTGWGAAVNSADLRVGDTVVVMGIGGIGINAVQGARHLGAMNIIAVDPVAFKRDKAVEMGATHVCAGIEDAAELARGFTNGQGADAAIVAVGVTTGAHVGGAYGAIRKGGTVVIAGVGNLMEVGIPIPPGDLTLSQKRLQGTVFGDGSASADIPRQLEMYRAGLLKLDELITTTYPLDQIAQGYEDMRAGQNIRGVVVF